MSPAAIVDENVPIVANDATRTANGLSPLAAHASDRCRLEAVRFLRNLMLSGIVVLDDAGQCLAKYRRYLAGAGQPGTGDAFLRHVHDNAYNLAKAEQVHLAVDADEEFSAFPRDPALATFDRADRVFVALALSSHLEPSIANAVDSDYAEHSEALTEAGVKVIELCRERPARRPPGRDRGRNRAVPRRRKPK